jgi:hypothetical protein
MIHVGQKRVAAHYRLQARADMTQAQFDLVGKINRDCARRAGDWHVAYHGMLDMRAQGVECDIVISRSTPDF